jgi:hypothetical protein
MTGLYRNLDAWFSESDFLYAACEFLAAFAIALAFGYLVFRCWKQVAAGCAEPLSGARFGLLFACASWGFFIEPAFGERFLKVSVLPALWFAVGTGLFFAPIAVLAGMPLFLIYVFKRPPLKSSVIYSAAIAISSSSYLYLAWLHWAFRTQPS